MVVPQEPAAAVAVQRPERDLNRINTGMTENRLVVFVKNEEAGKVKTRLAADTGDQKALNVYRTLLKYTRSVIEGVEAGKVISYSRFIPETDLWQSAGYVRTVQKGEDLGERMLNAFKRGLVAEQCSGMVLIGSDCAELKAKHIEKAFTLMNNKDLVLGPASDGGYYLIGMKSPYRELFQNIAWSTGDVLNQTLKKAEESGISVALLPELNDVDTIEDWRKVKSRFGPVYD